ncbi:beta-glucosidase 47 [Actinidia rufa]|uniref:Beta-glucosidase 47 n=1 Tax=Actinidia rufa TaxID=165716 RepID=A0A7J0GKQ8_9ERIC|nr:beta-glucosidase 47 [Actinidia rufa]
MSPMSQTHLHATQGISSAQIEGAILEDGKNLSNWDVFTHRQGTIKNGENGDVAEDHYHRYLEDIDILHSLGVSAYRFSISWARVLPRGKFGEVNPNGVKFYNNIIDNLLLKGIQPFVTIAHHDFPQELEDRYGSWLSPLMQYEEFAYYANTCFRNFGERVKYWITINEPNLFTNMAYIKECIHRLIVRSLLEIVLLGILIPSHSLLCTTCYWHMPRLQSSTMSIFRFFGILRPPVVSSTSTSPLASVPTSTSAQTAPMSFLLAFSLNKASLTELIANLPSGASWLAKAASHCQFMEVTLQKMQHFLGNELPTFSPKEKQYIRGSIDFIAVNHYSTLYTKDCIYSSCILGGDRPIRGFAYTTGQDQNGVPIGEPTGMPVCFVVPEGMEEIIDYLKKRYQKTSLWYAPPAQPNVQVKDLLHDVKRIDFHKAYLSSLARAIRDGADVRGYFIWTLMDDFEWIHGYDATFGLYCVDPQTLKRIPKLSAKWYRNFLTNSSNNKEEVIRRSSFRNKNVIATGLRAKQAEI